LHARVACKGCHPTDFRRAVPTVCSGCHRDAHGGELGMHCEGCHDESSWASSFDADVHRRTNFPLSGRHALVPCTECHRDVRERGFSRVAVDCYGCHQTDYQRTPMTAAIDHIAAGLGTDCRRCHNTFRFAPASYPEHDQCFRITSGHHAQIRCLNCHFLLKSGPVTGACMSDTAACSNCHEHTCARTNTLHAKVPGYECKDRKCYECHRLAQ
jgi:hypothetical protein